MCTLTPEVCATVIRNSAGGAEGNRLVHGERIGAGGQAGTSVDRQTTIKRESAQTGNRGAECLSDLRDVLRRRSPDDIVVSLPVAVRHMISHPR